MSTMERFNSFLREVRVEARKVTWPSRGELWESTLVVLVTVAIISCFIAVVDRAVSMLVTLIL
jgi:preprotein translocase subunit SecE